MTPENCPYCSAESSVSSPGHYSCGTYNNCGCRDTFPQSALCRERASNIELRDELETLRARVRELETALENAKADASSWQAQSERFEKQFLEAAERVGELEGLPIHIYATDDADVELIVSIPQSRFVGDDSSETLGEAMPRREGV